MVIARWAPFSDKSLLSKPIIVGESFYVPANSQELGLLRDRIPQTDGVCYPQILWNLENLLNIISLTKSSINLFRQSRCSWLFIPLISGMELQR